METYSQKTEAKRKQLGDTITNAYKDRMKELDLVDSGSLISTFKATVAYTDDGITVITDAQDYFKYVEARYNLTSYVMDTPEVSKGITDLMGSMVVDIIL